jgi:hypothetical protein
MAATVFGFALIYATESARKYADPNHRRLHAVLMKGEDKLMVGSVSHKIIVLFKPGILLIFLIILSITISNLRIYHRTRMRSFFFFIMAGFSSSVGLLGLASNLESVINFLDKGTFGMWLIASLCFIGFGFLSECFGFALLVTFESGVWREVSKRTSYMKRLSGNVPTIEKDRYPPVMKKHHGILLGILMAGIGLIFAVLSGNKLAEPSSTIISIIFLTKGILLTIFSLRKL